MVYMQTKERKINVELLRIISMFMIVILHFLGHGGVLKEVNDFSVSYYVSWIIEAFSFVAVNCYVLITGYFQVNSNIKVQKLLVLWGKTFFYSVVLFVIAIVFFNIDISFKSLIQVILPVSSGEYWFVSVYIMLYILSPFINHMLNTIEQKQHMKLIGVLVILFSVIPNLAFSSEAIWLEDGMGICWFVTLYCTGAYIRKYYVPTYQKKKLALVYVCTTLLIPVFKFGVHLFTKVVFGHDIMSGMFYSNNSVLMLASSVLFFVLILNIRIENKAICKMVLWLSPATFGVYLIHENPYMRDWIWSLLNIKKHLHDCYFGVWAIVVVLAIYIICSIVDKIRSCLFIKIEKSQTLYELSIFIEQKMQEWTNKILINGQNKKF